MNHGVDSAASMNSWHNSVLEPVCCSYNYTFFCRRKPSVCKCD